METEIWCAPVCRSLNMRKPEEHFLLQTDSLRRLRLLALILLLFVLVSPFSRAQPVIPCDSLKVDSVWLQQAGINRMMIRLQFRGFPNSIIGYPYFPAVLNQLGDTIAKGQMEFFGQAGGTSQIYSAITLLNELPVSQVIYLQLVFNSDTCLFPWIFTRLRADFSQASFIHFQEDRCVIICRNFPAHTAYRIFNAAGTIVSAGVMEKGEGSIPFRGLPPGLYCLRTEDGFYRKLVR